MSPLESFTVVVPNGVMQSNMSLCAYVREPLPFLVLVSGKGVMGKEWGGRVHSGDFSLPS